MDRLVEYLMLVRSAEPFFVVMTMTPFEAFEP